MPLPHRARLAAAAGGILAGALCLTLLATPSSDGARTLTANAAPYQRYNSGLPAQTLPNGLPADEGPAEESRPVLRFGWSAASPFRQRDSVVLGPQAPTPGADSADAHGSGATPSGPQQAGAPETGEDGRPGGASQADDDPPAPTATVFDHTQHSDGKRVALTFDDGPSPVFTPQVLALLRQYQVKATFCMIGEQARAFPDMVRAVADAGHRLCDHTMSHDERLPQRSTARIRHEILDDRDLLTHISGAPVHYYRAPGGAFSARVDGVAVDGGMQPLGWSVDTDDWKRPGVSSIIAAVQHELRPGGVILMHDAGGPRGQTLAALRQLIPWLIGQGYQFDFPA